MRASSQLLASIHRTDEAWRSVEVVLAVLLSTFKFELGEQPVYWNLAPIVYPSITKDGSEPMMPMKMSLLKSLKRV